MTDAIDPLERARLRELHEARARSEIAAANALAPGSDVVAHRGDLMPVIAVLKGLPGPAESSGGAAVSGADGLAAEKALERLGYEPAAVFWALTRPEPSMDAARRAARVRALIEAVDAPLVLSLDAEAAEDVAAAFSVARLAFGREHSVAGRRLVAVDGLELSLADARRKSLVWKQLQAAAPRGPVF